MTALEAVLNNGKNGVLWDVMARAAEGDQSEVGQAVGFEQIFE